LSSSGKHRLGATRWHRHGIEPGRPPKIDDVTLQLAARGTLLQANVYYLPILRDPRGVVNSECHHVQKELASGKFGSAVKQLGRRYSLWHPSNTSGNGAKDEKGGRPRISCDAYAEMRIQDIIDWTNLRFRFYMELIKQSGPANPRVRYTTYSRLQLNLTSEVKEMALYMTGANLSELASMSFVSRASTKTNENTRKATLCGFQDELRPETVVSLTQTTRRTLLPELHEVLGGC
jgi:hypothetical protein